MNKHNINNGEADHMNTQYYLADEVDAELERYETARQEDARRLEQVKGERDDLRKRVNCYSGHASIYKCNSCPGYYVQGYLCQCGRDNSYTNDEWNAILKDAK